MSRFKVLAVDMFAGEVRAIDEYECDGIAEAHRKMGELSAHRVGVIILDEHDGVWGEISPAQIYEMTPEQRGFYRHFKPRESLAA